MAKDLGGFNCKLETICISLKHSYHRGKQRSLWTTQDIINTDAIQKEAFSHKNLFLLTFNNYLDKVLDCLFQAPLYAKYLNSYIVKHFKLKHHSYQDILTSCCPCSLFVLSMNFESLIQSDKNMP